MNNIDIQKELYGYFAINTFSKLISNKLTNFSLSSKRIYRKILDTYFTKLNIEKNKPSSLFKETKLFMKSLPSLYRINKYAKNGETDCDLIRKNIYFLKLCLDIYENYFKTFDLPLMKNYKEKFLKTAIKFYKSITKENFQFINQMLSHSSMKTISIYN